MVATLLGELPSLVFVASAVTLSPVECHYTGQ
jgi:hypothetical protein